MTSLSPTLLLVIILAGSIIIIGLLGIWAKVRAARNHDSTNQKSDGLSPKAYVVFSLCFFVIPGVCVLVSSVLYYWWKESKPRQATQINALGFVIVGIQLLLYLVARQIGQG